MTLVINIVLVMVPNILIMDTNDEMKEVYQGSFLSTLTYLKLGLM